MAGLIRKAGARVAEASSSGAGVAAARGGVERRLGEVGAGGDGQRGQRDAQRRCGSSDPGASARRPAKKTPRLRAGRAARVGGKRRAGGRPGHRARRSVSGVRVQVDAASNVRCMASSVRGMGFSCFDGAKCAPEQVAGRGGGFGTGEGRIFGKRELAGRRAPARRAAVRCPPCLCYKPGGTPRHGSREALDPGSGGDPGCTERR